jgi:hypothetical protein
MDVCADPHHNRWPSHSEIHDDGFIVDIAIPANAQGPAEALGLTVARSVNDALAVTLPRL